MPAAQTMTVTPIQVPQPSIAKPLRGIVVNTVNRFARGYTIAGGLVLTWLGLLLTDLVVPASGFAIEGVGTWIAVTLIVWAAGIAYGEVDTAPPPRLAG